jgi:hypothetical protein
VNNINFTTIPTVVLLFGDLHKDMFYICLK